MSDEGAPANETHITFTIKSSSDQKFAITVPESITVLDLKQRLSTAEYANVEPGRQRLIYSGRVLKDPDQLSTYKIKDGNTVHMVKGAASSSSQQQGSSASSAAPVAGQNSPSSANVPSNIAAGTGNDPLAGLTGARYAGYAQMPGAGMFGPDGGMGPPPNPDDMLRMLENPMFQAQMNEAMNNPQVIQMLQNNPMIRDQPFLRDMLNNPEMRRMMMDPEFIRTSMRMSQIMGGGRAGGQAGGMPAPGVTDNTPQDSTGTTEQTSDNTQQQREAPNPFNMGFFRAGPPGQGDSNNVPINPFAALFGGGANPQAPNNTNASGTSTNSTENTTQTTSDQPTEGQNTNQQQQNIFASLFGQPPAGGQGQQNNPIGAMAQQMMQNPEMMQSMMRMMGGGAAGGESGGAGGAFNPFAPFGDMAQQQQQQQDTRPPEEQFAEQLRSLNEMGFYDFDANVRALRRSGGSVQGAVASLLGDM